MRKQDKKIENKIRIALTAACESALKQVIGFQWLTHVVNYDNFPSSLKITCIFDTNENLIIFLNSQYKNELIEIIQAQLTRIDIKIKSPHKNILFDSEERFTQQH